MISYILLCLIFNFLLFCSISAMPIKYEYEYEYELNKKNLRLNLNERSWLVDNKKFINGYIKERIERLNYDLFKNKDNQKELNETYKNFDLIHHFIKKTDIWVDIYF